MIIHKNILSMAKVADDSGIWDYNGLFFTRDSSRTVVYSTCGRGIMRTSFYEIESEDYPYLNDDYSSKHNTLPLFLENSSINNMKKICMKVKNLPILNNTVLIDEMSFNDKKEVINCITTDLNNINKITVECKTTDKISIFEEFFQNMQIHDDEDVCKSMHFNPFLLNNYMMTMAEVVGINKREVNSIKITFPKSEDRGIYLSKENNGILCEAYVMPVIE